MNYIFNPFTPIAKSDKSHVRGWASLWAQRLDARVLTKGEWDLVAPGDHLYMDHGVNFSGALNLFGGFNDDVHAGCETLMNHMDSGVTLSILDIPYSETSYYDQISKRLGSKTTAEAMDQNFIDDFNAYMERGLTVQMKDLGLTDIILGDSHSGSYSLPHQAIERINGQTLYSAMSYEDNGLTGWISNQLQGYADVSSVTLCLGSVDIRFHLHRLGIDADHFAGLYSSAILRAQDALNVDVVACCPVPIEHEGRRIPGSGKYLGEPFYGSRQDRLDMTMRFIDALGDRVVSPPDEWYSMDGETYAKDIMEMSGSVHIAPTNYNSVLEWSSCSL